MPSTDSAPTGASMDTIVALSKRRGFVFPNSEIYGGLRSSWDYGPVGVLLKRNVKDAWFRAMVQERDDIIGLDAAIIMSPKVWEASGHVATFSDPLVECTVCNHRFRLDKIDDPDACPNCGARNSFTEPRQFNLMFKTYLGPVATEENIAYLRPETAQGIFVNYELARAAARKKLPFGIAQIGKSFRNEITPGNFTFRTREFEQMEMEFFCAPEDAPRWLGYWLEERKQWYLDLGVRPENLRLRAHTQDELAHYAAACSDVEYLFPWGWDEIEGIANRGDFDLRSHSEYSGVDLSYFDQEANRRFLPHVIEPAAGADRATLAFLLDAYDEEEVAPGDTRVVLRLHPRLAPIKVAVLPLSKNERLVPLASDVAAVVRPAYMSEFDVTGSIGKRYRRQDEIGTPFCVTIDFESLEDNAVTIRERDAMTQKRVPIPELLPALRDALGF